MTVKLHALVSRVLIDDGNRVQGVEFFDSPHLYRAAPGALLSGELAAPRRTVRASREVILAGGTFNTPQILMLSGIGPAVELRKHQIAVRVDLPGVGRNLQDRYEIGVVSRMKKGFGIYHAPEVDLADWKLGRGIYTTNGVAAVFIKRSAKTKADPDLALLAIPGFFDGYKPGFSHPPAEPFFTWALLKAHTNNAAGVVQLKSSDPRDTPEINFHYFDEGDDSSGDDLQAVVEGVEYVREIAARTPDLFDYELLPGQAVSSHADIEQFVKDNAWGHHACGTCKIGKADDAMAVLDSRFRVRGVEALRVVDASVFPRIPGLFVVSAVYMIGEKASDVIREDHSL